MWIQNSFIYIRGSSPFSFQGTDSQRDHSPTTSLDSVLLKQLIKNRYNVVCLDSTYSVYDHLILLSQRAEGRMPDFIGFGMNTALPSKGLVLQSLYAKMPSEWNESFWYLRTSLLLNKPGDPNARKVIN